MDVTKAEDVAIPTRIVTLQYLKTKSGEPVKIYCEPIDELTLAKMYGMPGLRSADGDKLRERDPMEVMRIAEAMTPELIHAGTALADAEGNPTIRPAFHFDDAHKVQGSIDARFIRLEERLSLVNAVLELSGVGGAAKEASFHDGGGEGSPGGVGAVENGAGQTEVAGKPDEAQVQ
jgi:hypothetical protein